MGLISKIFGNLSDLNEKPNIEWVDIPAGSYTMGSTLEECIAYSHGWNSTKDELQHQVTLSAFKMSKYQITFKQYDSFCKSTGRIKPNDNGWGRGVRPVINVSWKDAKAFAEWLDCRLPTEAEWEYACRAGTTTPFNTGKVLGIWQANFEFAQRKTLPVGSFAPNSWGLYDMHGNVDEWCSDWYQDYPASAQINPKEEVFLDEGNVIRGGNYNTPGNNCRSSKRSQNYSGLGSPTIGFRIVYFK